MRKLYDETNEESDTKYKIKVPKGTFVKIHGIFFTLQKSIYVSVDETKDDFRIADHNVSQHHLE